MQNAFVCQLCMTKEDLIRITSEKQYQIKSFLHLEPNKDVNSRICINCSSFLSCFDKFYKNSIKTQVIFGQAGSQLHQNLVLKGLYGTDDSLNVAFETIQSWLIDVNLILRHFSMNAKMETGNNLMENQYSEKKNCMGVVDEPIQIDEEHEYELDIGPEMIKNQHFDNFGMEDEAWSNERETDASIFELYVSRDEEGLTRNFESPDETRSNIVESTTDNDDLTDLSTIDLQHIGSENFNKDVYFEETKNDGKSIYKCKTCDEFIDTSLLVGHRNKHLGLRPFICSCIGCKSAFHTLPSLVKHLRKVHHTSKKQIGVLIDSLDVNFNEYLLKDPKHEQRPYKCPVCKRELQKQELIFHLNIHNDIKPFNCIRKKCLVKFATPFHALEHIKSVHKMNLDTSYITDPTFFIDLTKII